MESGEKDTPTDTPRLFVGVRPDARAQRFFDGLQAHCRSLPGAAGRHHPRWTGHANRHLTLAFLGDTPASLLPALEEQLQQLAASTPRCSGRIVALAPFPQRRSRLLAAELLTNPALDRLHEGCRQVMRTLGMKPESATYRPHFTLARNRRGFAGFEPIALDFCVQLDNIVLYESLLAPGGSQYQPLWEAQLCDRGEE
ncbi:RNA 2',3'-cyclic phosphodiesterase [Microbulbifer sp. SAOS-129_SWC]|uniref:RNA 2',3'-cyclic phosphodiesterase n=1 Tax=Microbulbifer sp. SAOS-129_SWC TaxID=3145235 RepID=UPI0032172491